MEDMTQFFLGIANDKVVELVIRGEEIVEGREEMPPEKKRKKDTDSGLPPLSLGQGCLTVFTLRDMTTINRSLLHYPETCLPIEFTVVPELSSSQVRFFGGRSLPFSRSTGTVQDAFGGSIWNPLVAKVPVARLTNPDGLLHVRRAFRHGGG